MWRKGNPCALLVRIQVGAATMVGPQKIKNRTTYEPEIPLLSIYPKKPKPLTQKNICTNMFTVALFTIAKIWKQPKCPLTSG